MADPISEFAQRACYSRPAVDKPTVRTRRHNLSVAQSPGPQTTRDTARGGLSYLAPLLIGAIALLITTGRDTVVAPTVSAWSFPDTSFDTPATPKPLKQNVNLTGWDLLVHEIEGTQRGGGSGDARGVLTNTTPPVPINFQAQHSPACGVPTSGRDRSGFHNVSSLYGENGDGGMGFTCNNHLMLTNHCQPNCFSSTVLTLPMELDWSTGPATFSFNMNTRHVNESDWVELFLTPFVSQLAYPSSLSPYQDNVGPPTTGLSFAFGANLPPSNSCSAATSLSQCGFDQWSTGLANWCGCDPNAGGDTRNGVRQLQLTDIDPIPGYVEDAVLGAGPANNGRARYNLTVSRSHVTFGLAPQAQQPAGVTLNAAYVNGLNWIDADLRANPLPYSRAIVQFVAQDYQACLGLPSDPCNGIDTWHMSGFSMSSAVPLRIIRANQNWANDATSVSVDGKRATQLTFPSPAREGSYLRTCYYGDPVQAQYSVNGGATWLNFRPRLNSPSYACALASIPTGTSSLYVTGVDKYLALNNPWHYDGFSIVSETSS